jgi:Zn-dependent peptidase ImmA (M78 family)/DNA-binding XRE family transcriptional regulator
MPFNPVRLTVARHRRLKNKKELADALGVTAHTVSRWESGQKAPVEGSISAIAEELRFPVEFFEGANLAIPNPEMVSFRSQTSMTAEVRNAALAAGSIGFLLYDHIEDQFNLSDVDVPDLHLSEPEIAAVTLRRLWGLGNEPISNIIHLLESKGVRVLSLAENSKSVNAFSLWRDEKPFVFLNTMKTAENSRFDAAHELGHLVLHQDGHTRGREAEEQANSFASEFLMPREDMLSRRIVFYDLSQMISLKKRWKVSLAALNYRLHKINLVGDWRYRDFCIQIASRYKTNEPEGIERERSVVWQRVMQSLWADGITQVDIAKTLHLPVSEVETLIFGIVHTSQKQPVRGTSLTLVHSKLTA